jgi:nucleoside phosphorylase
LSERLHGFAPTTTVEVDTLVFVAAAKREFAGFRRHIARITPLQWPVDWSRAAEWKGRRLILMANGFGGARSGEALDLARSRESFNAVISIGFCGALDRSLRPSDIFVASEVRATGKVRSYPAREPCTGRSYASGILLSVDSVVQSVEEKRALRATGGDAVEMEAAAVAERTADWSLPFFSVRVVTDTADEGFVCDLNAARRADGRLSPARLMLAALKHPASQIPELWRLRQRSASAARALGDFLADCEF